MACPAEYTLGMQDVGLPRWYTLARSRHQRYYPTTWWLMVNRGFGSCQVRREVGVDGWSCGLDSQSMLHDIMYGSVYWDTEYLFILPKQSMVYGTMADLWYIRTYYEYGLCICDVPYSAICTLASGVLPVVWNSQYVILEYDRFVSCSTVYAYWRRRQSSTSMSYCTTS